MKEKIAQNKPRMFGSAGVRNKRTRRASLDKSRIWLFESGIDEDVKTLALALNKSSDTGEIPYDMILYTVGQGYDVHPSEITSKRRKDIHTEMRFVFMWIASRVYGGVYKEIGQQLSKDHSSVHHGCKVIDGFVDVNNHSENKLKSRMINIIKSILLYSNGQDGRIVSEDQYKEAIAVIKAYKLQNELIY